MTAEEKKKARQKQYYEAHREWFREYGKRYREEHREALKEYQKRYRAQNSEELAKKRKVYFAAWAEKNKEKLRQSQQKYYYDRTPNEPFRAWMQETGTTQTALAEKIGVTQGTISNWYTGTTPVNMQKLRAALPELADYLEGAQ